MQNPSGEEYLSRFISLEKKVRDAGSQKEFGFCVSNDTKQILNYSQAIFWRNSIAGLTVQSVSATAQINQDAPYIVWLKKVAKHCKAIIEIKTISKNDLPKHLANDWDEWVKHDLLWLPFVHKEQTSAGMIFIRDKPWNESEIKILAELNNAYTHAWYALITAQEKPLSKKNIKQFFSKRNVWIGTALVTAILLIPIRQSALAPAEIVAKNPLIVSSPMEGVIEKIFIEPNMPVKAGQALFSLDPLTIKNRFEEAQKSLKVSEEKLRKAYQHAFYNEASKAELPVLQAEVNKAKNEVQYTKKLFQRVTIKAPKDGIAVYSNPKDWIGKPVKTGEQVMLVANPEQKEIDIELAVDDAISLTPGSEIKLFLNIAPLSPLYGKLRYASYTATENDEAILSYHLKADFNNDRTVPRIGLKGTAKVYGGRVVLIYYLLWKPISFLRRTIGI